MKMKCTVCETEYAVRKDIADKRAEKGITSENYVCLACRPKKRDSVYNITCSKCNKSVKSNKNRSEKLIAEGKMDTYLCRDCKPKAVKVPKAKATKPVVKAENKNKIKAKKLVAPTGYKYDKAGRLRDKKGHFAKIS